MKRTLSAADQAFYDRVQAFLQAHRPLGAGADIWRDPAWCAALCEAGFAVSGWPREWGGPGFTATQKFIWHSACCERIEGFCEAPAVALAGPLLAQLGDAQMQKRHLPEIRQLRQRWVVALAEPAQLELNQKRQLNGRLEWLTGVPDSHQLLSIARLAYAQPVRWAVFCCPLDRAGITVHTSRSLAGSDVFTLEFAAVSLHDADRVCELDNLAMLNLPSHQLGRSGVAVAQLSQLDRVLSTLSEEPDLEVKRDAAAVEVEALKAMEARYVDALVRGIEPPFPLHLLALKSASVEQKVGSLLMDSFGYYALPYPDLWLQHNEGPVGPPAARGATQAWLERTVSENYASVSRDLYGKLAQEQQDIGEH